MALYHVVPEQRIIAAQILGNLGCQQALREFRKIIQSGEENYFFLRSILLATAKINSPESRKILVEAVQHTSSLVQNLARDLLEQVSTDLPLSEWDQHTG